jgi:hypothetical protein
MHYLIATGVILYSLGLLYVGNRWGRAALLKEQAFLAAAKRTVGIINQAGQNVKKSL